MERVKVREADGVVAKRGYSKSGVMGLGPASLDSGSEVWSPGTSRGMEASEWVEGRLPYGQKRWNDVPSSPPMGEAEMKSGDNFLGVKSFPIRK